MTTYEQLASAMLAAGIKNASTAKARDLAERSMYGLPMSDLERKLVNAWVSVPWKPETRYVKKGE